MGKFKEYYINKNITYTRKGYNRGKNGGDIEIAEIEFKEL